MKIILRYENRILGLRKKSCGQNKMSNFSFWYKKAISDPTSRSTVKPGGCASVYCTFLAKKIFNFGGGKKRYASKTFALGKFIFFQFP